MAEQRQQERPQLLADAQRFTSGEAQLGAPSLALAQRMQGAIEQQQWVQQLQQQRLSEGSNKRQRTGGSLDSSMDGHHDLHPTRMGPVLRSILLEKGADPKDAQPLPQLGAQPRVMHAAAPRHLPQPPSSAQQLQVARRSMEGVQMARHHQPQLLQDLTPMERAALHRAIVPARPPLDAAHILPQTGTDPRGVCAAHATLVRACHRGFIQVGETILR